MTRRLCVYKTDWPLKAPFRISGRTFTSVGAVVVEVGEGGLVGRGEGVGVYYLGETPERMIAQIEAVRVEIERGVDNTGLLGLMAPGGARNAVDCAIWDLIAKQRNRSIWELVGIEPRSVRTVFTIGLEADAGAMGDKAKAASGFNQLKVKLSSDDPAAKLRAVRAARPDAEIVVDANQGLTADLLRGLLPVLVECRVAMIEQPLPRGDDLALASLRTSIPICADESCLHRGELPDVSGRYDMINIKLDKTGGLTEALALARDVRTLNKRVMVGNMLGSSLSMAPAFVVAQLCSFVDIDGPLNATSDYLDGLLYAGDEVSVPPGPFWANMHRV